MNDRIHEIRGQHHFSLSEFVCLTHSRPLSPSLPPSLTRSLARSLLHLLLSAGPPSFARAPSIYFSLSSGIEGLTCWFCEPEVNSAGLGEPKVKSAVVGHSHT